MQLPAAQLVEQPEGALGRARVEHEADADDEQQQPGGGGEPEEEAVVAGEGGSSDPIQVQLFDGDQLLLSLEVPISSLDGKEQEWALPQRVLPRMKLRMEVAAPAGSPYILLTQALLTEATEP